MKKTTFKLLLVILFLVPIASKAESVSVSISDTLIPSGKIYKVPITGKLSDISAGKLTITLNFNALALDISSASGGSDLGLLDDNLSIDTIVNSWDSVDISINSNNFQKNYDGILFFLNIEALVSPDTLSTIKPILATLDDKTVSGDFLSGIIRTTPPIVNQKYIEGIGLGYPNPFNDIASFRFTIEKESKVKFKVYSALGRLVQAIPEGNKYVDFKIFDNMNQLIDDPSAKLFAQGSYRLEIQPVPWEFSSGVHYIIMETKSGVYKSNFVYVK